MTHKHIHFVGIKGVGMTPLAIIAKEAGMSVTGSDVADEFITDAALEKSGITVQVGFDPHHITGADLVITTGAHGGQSNPEVVAAKEQGISVLMQGQAVGEFMKGEIIDKSFEGIAVAGSHGKTTTTAMIATVLAENQRDPSYVVGTSGIVPLGLPGHFGKGQFFVAEADEYATEPGKDTTAKFLWLSPQMAVFTNIEHDHPDVYPSLNDVRKAFLALAQKLPDEGVLIACEDDPQVQLLLREYTGRRITYGVKRENDYVLSRVSVSGEQLFFWVQTKDAVLGEFVLSVTGEHNALNALAATVVCLEAGLSIDQIKMGLKAFRGTKRRLEYIGTLTSGALVYDDYAHHPTEIRKSLEALQLRYPEKKLLVIFQPHTYSRTKSLFEEFSSSFTAADEVLLMDIYASAREEPDLSVSSEKLAEAIQAQHKTITFLPTAKDVVQYLDQKQYHNDTVIVTMGAGDVYKLLQQLSWAQ